GGTVEPRADWTKAAQDYIAADARSWLQARQVELAPMDGALSAHTVQVIKLNGVVGQAILTHLNAGALKLPSKGNALDWTLGPGTNELRDRYGADYALFIFVRDSYTTTGRAIF